uniref:Uncharacterized protein n=1 Tax=viral metagenome TaxID=1070528 RepID=A0A6M3LNK7_9ZZZZ
MNCQIPIDKYATGVYDTSMKYGEHGRKIDRNKSLLKYHREHPEMKLAKIARIFGLSRQRVWQIVNPSSEVKE